MPDFTKLLSKKLLPQQYLWPRQELQTHLENRQLFKPFSQYSGII